jgi:signal transduction histidine kinase
VEIACAAGNAILVVRDGGKGIAGDVLAQFRAGPAGGIGLAGMRGRLAELGGTLDVQSGESGSVIQARLSVAACDWNAAKGR